MKFEFSRQILGKKKSNIKVHGNPSSGSRVVPSGVKMTKPTVAFRNLGNAPKKVNVAGPNTNTSTNTHTHTHTHTHTVQWTFHRPHYNCYLNARTWPSYRNSCSIQFSIQKLKLPVAYPVKQLSIINDTHKFTAVFTGSSPMIHMMSHTNPIPPPHKYILWTPLVLFFPRGDLLPLRRSRYNLVSIPTTCPTYLPHLNTRQKVQLWSPSLSNIRHPSVNFSQTLLIYYPDVCTVHYAQFTI